MSEQTASQGQEQPPAPAASKAKGSKLVMAILVLSFANLGTTGFVLTKLMKPLPVQAMATGPSPAHSSEAGPVSALDSFVVNLNEPGSTRYLKAGLEVELTDAHAVEALARSKPAVRDDVLGYLSNLSVSDTLGEDKKSRIRLDLTGRLDKVLGGGKVRKLYFSEFVVQ